MYDDKNLVYVLTILESIEKIKIYCSVYKDADEFLWANNQLNFNGTVNLLIAIGEESKKIDSNLKKEFSNIKWKPIAGIRDKLAHDYRGIDPNIVWDVIRNDVDVLKDALIQMLPKIKYDKKVLKKALKTKYYSHLSYIKITKD